MQTTSRLIGCICLVLLTFVDDVSAINATSGEPYTLWHIHGAQDFYPCMFIKSNSNAFHPDAILCDEAALITMSNSIPTIHPEGKIIREIRFQANSGLSTLPPKSFEKTGPNLQALFIEGGEIRVIKREALLGLDELRILEIRNAENRQSNNGLAGRLFTADGELKHLKKLRRLILENVDLSDGLAAYAFYDMSRQLEECILRGNNLEIINPYTFDKSESVKSLKLLSLEKQGESLNWLENANRWAQDLGGLKMLSLSENNLTDRTLDFGYSLNRKLRGLKLENCSLTEIPDELLENFSSLEEIHIGRNSFTIISPEEAIQKLWGIQRFKNLTKLSLAGNTGLIYKQPPWFRTSMIKELDYSKSLLRKIGAGELPQRLEVLHLESTFLEEIDPDWTSEVPHFAKLYLDSSDIKSVRINGTKGDWGRALEPLRRKLKHVSFARCNIISKSLRRGSEDDYEVTGLRLGLQNLQALESLDLSGNYFTHIPMNAFQNMPNLKVLNLSSNLLQTLTTIESNCSTSESIPQIQELDLSNNALTSLLSARWTIGFSVSLNEILSKGARLKLSGNPIICDCRISWLLKEKIGIDNFTCLGRNKFNGMGIESIHVSDLSKNQSQCPTWDFVQLPEPVYPFRPARVFAYDKQLKRVYFAIKGCSLKLAWENIVRQQPVPELQKLLAQLNNLTLEIISKLQTEYIVFKVHYWPIGEFFDTQNTDWHILDEGLMHSNGKHREYIFHIDPIDVKRAHTVCFINALDRRDDARSTLCQIFQPSELTMTAKMENLTENDSHAHIPLWLVLLLVACIIIVMCCFFYFGVKFKGRQNKKDETKENTEPLEQNNRYPEYNTESHYEKLENYYLENTRPPPLNNGLPELPKRSKCNRILPQLPKTPENCSTGDLSARRHRARLEKQVQERRSTSKLPLGSPRLPRPLIYQRPATIIQPTSLDDNGYVKMDVDDEYLEARPQKRMRKDVHSTDDMLDSYIMGVPRAAINRQMSVPATNNTSPNLNIT